MKVKIKISHDQANEFCNLIQPFCGIDMKTSDLEKMISGILADIYMKVKNRSWIVTGNKPLQFSLKQFEGYALKLTLSRINVPFDNPYAEAVRNDIVNQIGPKLL